jgi:hypothetical protein
MVEAASPAPFVITKAEFVFELLIILLDPPPQLVRSTKQSKATFSDKVANQYLVG